MSIPYSRFLFGSISWYSSLIVLGIVLALFIGAREEKRIGLPRDTMIDVALVAVPCGILGARLYFVAMEWPQFSRNLLSILYIWEGGVAIYGAVIGGALGVYIYCRKKKISFPKVLDMVAPGLLLAQAIGRWGNYFNMEAYGPAIANPTFQFFPIGVQILENGVPTWHMATFFYESLWNFVGFLALMSLRKKQKQEGNLFFWYLLIYGSGRFIIEQLREDSLWLGGIRVSQGLSLLLCAVSAIVLLWRSTPHRKHHFYVACAFALIAVARWFCLSSWVYIWLLLAMLGLAAYCSLSEASANGKRHSPILWFLAPLALDALGLICARTKLLSPAFGTCLHTLLCSLTLPCYILWFQQKLSIVLPAQKEA